MKIKLREAKVLDNWYEIVRAEYDGAPWMVEVEPNVFHLMCPERLSPEASVEGNLYEMIDIANCIKQNVLWSKAGSSRCAVKIGRNGVYFWNPRNSKHSTLISFEDADDFANQVLAEAKEQNV